MALFGSALRNIKPAIVPTLTVGLTYSEYKQRRERGEGFIAASTKAVGETFLYTAFFAPMLALDVAPLLPIVHQSYSNMLARKQRQWTPMSMSNYDRAADSQTAQTSRARAVEAIQNSRLNARSYIGNEAGLFATRFR